MLGDLLADVGVVRFMPVAFYSYVLESITALFTDEHTRRQLAIVSRQVFDQIYRQHFIKDCLSLLRESFFQYNYALIT